MQIKQGKVLLFTQQALVAMSIASLHGSKAMQALGGSLLCKPSWLHNHASPWWLVALQAFMAQRLQAQVASSFMAFVSFNGYFNLNACIVQNSNNTQNG